MTLHHGTPGHGQMEEKQVIDSHGLEARKDLVKLQDPTLPTECKIHYYNPGE